MDVSIYSNREWLVRENKTMGERVITTTIEVTKIYNDDIAPHLRVDKKAYADELKEKIRKALKADNVVVTNVQEFQLQGLRDQMEDVDVLNEFVKERDNAFINFVETGNMEMVDAYCKKYGVSMPEDSKVKQAGIYKAVQACTNIPEEVKNKAMVKCMELGFNPFMKE